MAEMGHLGMSASANLAQVWMQGMHAFALLFAPQDSRYFFTSLKKQNKNQPPATERENCKILFSISSWLPGLCIVASVFC